MEIDRARTSVQISTVPEEKQAQLEKGVAKTIQQAKDTFETAQTTNSNTKAYDAPAQPVMKADQATADLLSKQMISARLNDPGRKSTGEQKEVSGRTDLSREEQGAADSRLPNLPEKSQTHTPQGDDPRSKKELDAYLKNHGYDNSGSPSKLPDTGHTKEEVENAMSGGASGSTDPRERLNEKYEQQKGYDKTTDDIRSGFQSQIRDAVTQQDKAANNPYGKGMMADDGASLGIDPTQAEIDEAKKKAAEQDQKKTEPKESKSKWETVKEVVAEAFLGAAEHLTHMGGAKDAAMLPIILEKSQVDNKDFKSGLDTIGQMKAGNYKGMGSGGGAHDATQEGSDHAISERLHQQVKNLGAGLGINPYEVPTSHYSPGASGADPSQDGGVDTSGGLTNVYGAAGKEVLVGQSRPDGEGGSGGGNFQVGSGNDNPNDQFTSRDQDRVADTLGKKKLKPSDK